MFEFSQLRCFVAVAEELHFGRAASRVFMTQPPLSRQIQLLERAVGVQLLERTSRNVRLTAAGKAFYLDAASMLRLADQAAVTARRTGSGEAGQVVIGYTAVAGYMLIPNLIAAAQRLLPDIDIVLKEMVSPEQLDALTSESIDLAFMRPTSGEQVFQAQYHLLLKEPLVLALPADHPLAKKARIRIGDMAQQALIMYAPDKGKYFYDKINELFTASSVNPRYIQHIGQTHTIMALVRASIGMAIVPASAQHLMFENVVFRPLWRNDVFAEIYLAWRANHRNPALDLIRQFAIEHLVDGDMPKTESK